MKASTIFAWGILCLACFVVGFLTVFSPVDGHTTTVVTSQVIARDIPTYSRQARSVVLGTVVEVGDPYNFDLGVNDETTIQHDVVVRVEQVLRGRDEGRELTLAVEGGTLGGETVVAEDEASFRVGERVIIFVATSEFGEDVVFAGAYGKLTVNHDGTTVVGNAGFERPLQALVAEIRAP